MGLPIILSSPAFAGKMVDRPHIEKGVWGAELKSGYVFDDHKKEDGNWEAEITATYGIADWWGLEIGGVIEHENGEDDTELVGLLVESIVRLAEPGTLFVDPAMKFEYVRSLTGGPDEIEGKFLLGKDIGQF